MEWRPHTGKEVRVLGCSTFAKMAYSTRFDESLFSVAGVRDNGLMIGGYSGFDYTLTPVYCRSETNM
jgi:hypothetical protein